MVRPLFLAACNGRAAAAETLLVAGAALEAATGQGCRALHAASQMGHAAVVGLLLNAGTKRDASEPVACAASAMRSRHSCGVGGCALSATGVLVS